MEKRNSNVGTVNNQDTCHDNVQIQDAVEVIMTMDGCFSMKRVKNHAQSIDEPLLKDLYFLKIEKHNPIEANTEECNDFRSGDVRKKAADYCDVTGVFGVICKHGVIYRLANIEGGEPLN